MSKTMIVFAVAIALCLAGKMRSSEERPSKEVEGRPRGC